MTREEARYYLQSSGFSEEQIATIEQAFKQEPCEDAISRQTVMDALCNDCELFKNGEQTCFSKCEEYHFLATLPSVKPQEPTGHWISHYDKHTKEGWYECDRCQTERAFNTDYCPDCGAKMVSHMKERTRNDK